MRWKSKQQAVTESTKESFINVLVFSVNKKIFQPFFFPPVTGDWFRVSRALEELLMPIILVRRAF
jgi:hypothetical protein